MWAVALALVCVRAPAQESQGSCERLDALGQELRSQGKLSAARERFLSCSDPACPDAVRGDCSRRLNELARVQSTVVFDVKDRAGNQLSAVKASVDGKLLADTLTGAALPVDPGPHSYRLDAAGHVPYDGHFVLGEGQREWTEQVVMDTQSPTETGTRSSRGSVQRAAGLTVGAVGAASLVTGAVFGVLSIAAHDSYEKNCGSNIGMAAGACSQAGVDGEKDAAMKGTLSTIFFVAGGAAAVTGVVLFLTAPARVAGAGIALAPSGVIAKWQF